MRRRYLVLAAVALLVALLAPEGCSAPPAPTTGVGRGALDFDTPTAGPAQRFLQAATGPQPIQPTEGAPTLEPTDGPPPIERTARPGGVVRFASPIVPISGTRPPNAYFTPTPLPPGVTREPPPMGPLPPLPTGDPNIPRTAPTAPYETPIHVTPVPNGPTLFLPPRRDTVTPTVTPTP